jgi:ubiquinone/menaquinone biosynthesis C-methylase UbiE
MPAKTEVTFSGSIPDTYDRYLGPLLLAPYARDLAQRLPIHGLTDVLELACGTGIVTQAIRERLGEETRLVATDLSEGMLKVAQTKTMTKKVEWKVADATSLPFKDNSFDMVVCQFGVMFFPDKEKAMKEAFRVLRPGGRILFNTWDKIKYNDFPRVAQSVIAQMFENNPPEFYNIPFSYFDHFEIRTLLRGTGFNDIALSTIEMKVQGDAADAAKGAVEGNPIADEIKSRLGKDIKEATERVERAFASELGQRIAKGNSRAIVVGARKAGQLTPAPKPTIKVKTETDQTKPKAEKPRVAKARPKPKAKAGKA